MKRHFGSVVLAVACAGLLGVVGCSILEGEGVSPVSAETESALAGELGLEKLDMGNSFAGGRSSGYRFTGNYRPATRATTPDIGAGVLELRERPGTASGDLVVDLVFRESNANYYVMGYTFKLDYDPGAVEYQRLQRDPQAFGGNATPREEDGKASLLIYGIGLRGDAGREDTRLVTLEFKRLSSADPDWSLDFTSTRPQIKVVGGMNPSEANLPLFDPITLKVTEETGYR